MSTATSPTQPTSDKAPAPAPAPRVVFLGAGPGDPGLLTVRATKVLQQADVVVFDQGHLVEDFDQWLRQDVHVVSLAADSPDEITVAARAKELVKASKDAAKASATADAKAGRLRGHQVVIARVIDGDPTIFSGMDVEAAAVHKAGMEIEVVPGVSAVQAVPAYAGVSLTAGSHGNGVVHVIGPVGKAAPAVASDEGSTVVLLGRSEQVLANTAALLEGGRDPQTPVALTSSGTTTNQSTIISPLGEVADRAAGLGDLDLVATVGSCVKTRETLSWFETKPLFGWRVLVPRTKDQSGPMVDLITQHGATSHVVPTISVEPPRSPHQMDKAIRGLVTGRYEWIGFTSANAVRAVREKFNALGLDARAFSGLKIAAVGGVTAEALQAWGLEPDLVPSGEQSARGLADEWPSRDDVLDPIDRVFLPRADIATDALVAGLREKGWEVDDLVAYRTVRATPPPAPVRAAIKAGEYDAVVFTSSSTVRNLVGIAGKPSPSTVVACIGPATTETAKELGLRVDAVAAEPSGPAVIDSLVQFARQRAEVATGEGRPVTRPSQERSGSGRRGRR